MEKNQDPTNTGKNHWDFCYCIWEVGLHSIKSHGALQKTKGHNTCGPFVFWNGSTLGGRLLQELPAPQALAYRKERPLGWLLVASLCAGHRCSQLSSCFYIESRVAVSLTDPPAGYIHIENRGFARDSRNRPAQQMVRSTYEHRGTQ